MGSCLRTGQPPQADAHGGANRRGASGAKRVARPALDARLRSLARLDQGGETPPPPPLGQAPGWAVIRLAGVRVHLGGRWVLHGVAMAVAAGEVVAIAGPNGAGKSTLLRCAGGLLTPEGGTVLLAGRPLARWGRRPRARALAFLPQRVVLPFAATAGEVVGWGRYPHRHLFTGADPRGPAVVAAALARVEASALAERAFATLSGGEQQRCLIAAALAQEPRVLLLDEPTAGLDPPHAARLFRLLAELAKAGMAVAVVTHDLNLAACFAHRVVLLAHGAVITAGTPAAVLTGPHLEAAYGPGLVVATHPTAPYPVVLAAP
ncbi:MAG: hypothetical protein COW73_09075 [Nitrospirae bacterium CG18_big_fil_WC_8_21_14_2_50_70_55]|nr:MAG: hypothetical protein COW73_09075 [Nitrospirae bacterium CG18_big_fil_WC_8_21_14_2_50_70_55]